MLTRRRASADRLDRVRNDRLRVAIVAETFLPVVNGVTNSVLRVLEHLRREGHEAIVIAPGPGEDSVDGTPIVRLPGFDLPRYDDLRIGLPFSRFGSIYRDFRPDVVHLAAPTMIGATAARAARRQGIPTVAIFQTDIAGFAKRNGLGRMTGTIWNYLRWVHSHADLTLAPSSATAWSLRAHGIDQVGLWGRGVDLVRFDPEHRSDELHRFIAPNGDVVVGYVGRLAREKQVERMQPLTELPGVKVVIVGDGPERAALERSMPRAQFLGFQTGHELARTMATLDVFVHTGVDETFCQTLQEAMASGVATVAPAAGGPLDLVRHRETGYFWSPEAPETLAGAVADLAGDAELRARLGRTGRTDAEQRPWSKVLDELVGHYREVASRPLVRESGSRWKAA